MASKLEMYSELADRTAHQITNSFSEWTAFLKTAARLYKYPFHEQLLIYAQRPTATACAEYDVWNQRMGRYVRRGSSGIALIDTSGNTPRLKYVFDLVDTGGRENSRYPHIWSYKWQYEDAVSKALEEHYDVSGDEGLEVQLERVAAQLVDEYWNANQRDILGILADSFLEEYDDFNVGAAFRNAAVVSTTYMLLYRCGIDPSEHFLHEDFLDVFDFNTPSTLAALGTGISQISETVLRRIEAVVKVEERKLGLTFGAERTENHGQQPDLHTDRGLSGPEPGSGRERDAAPGQVREDAPGVSSEGTPGPLEQPHPDRETVPPLAGDRRDSGAALGGPDAEAGGGGRGDGGPEGPRPDEVGRADEQLQSPGGGNDPGGAGVQLTPQEPEPTATGDWLAEGVPVAQLTDINEHGQFTLFDLPIFPSEQEQMSQIQEAESVKTPSAISVAETPLETAKRLINEYCQREFGDDADYSDLSKVGLAYTTTEEGELEVQVSADLVDYRMLYEVDGEMVARLQFHDLDELNEFFEDLDFSELVAFAEEHREKERTVSVPAAYNAYNDIKEHHPDSIVLFQMGDFFEMYGEDARTAAEMLDLAITTRPVAGIGCLILCGVPSHRLDDYVELLRDKYDVTVAALGDNGERQITTRLSFDHEAERTLDAQEAVYGADAFGSRTLSTTPNLPEPYLPLRDKATQEDIDAAIQRWNGSIESKHAVARYMESHGREKDTAAWLSREYGGAPALPLHVTLIGTGEEATLPWPKAQRRIAQLIQQDRFYTDEEQDRFDNIDPIAIREALAQSGIVNGEVVDPDALANNPFIRQVREDVERITRDEAEHSDQPAPSGAFDAPGNGGREDMAGDTSEPADAPEPEQMPHSQPSESQNRPTYTSEPVAVYPAEENHLPFDVVVERLHVDEPERTPPTPTPTNFRITDDHLGEGGAKTKFKRNMAAITLLKELEFEGRQATPEEQAVLSQYVGWGGLADAFDEAKEGWKDEFAELYEALSPEEYAAARASTLNAHYTSPTVIKAIYEAVGNMGFETGNILEPSMGVGNFFGLLPDTMAGSKLYGVELDSITGRIAKQLYPQANITVAGFETTDRRDFYDLAVGNVPFGQYPVNDRAYNKLGFSIHDYFFAKALDQVRPGGVVAFVTSRYTMDKQSPEVRKYLAQRAELLGAIRLPNNAFRANAGTDVVSDIIFLQKRDRPIDIEPDWVHLGENSDGFSINSYFIDHPEMVLGTPSSESMQYGRQDFTVLPIEGANLADQLHEAIQNIHGQYKEAELPELGEGEKIDTSIPADPNVKNYSFTLVNGEVYYRENSRMVKPELNATSKERVKGMVELRDCVHALIDQQMNSYTPEEDIRKTQARLNRLYDNFTAKYGLINSRGNALAFSDDSAYYLLCALEVMDNDGNLERKSDIFTKRTIKPREVVTSVDTASEALALSISEKACVDLGYMASLMGGPEKIPQIVEDLRGVIFKDPKTGPFDLEGPSWAEGWQTADEYLSGNVRRKLRVAEAAADTDPFFTFNVTALRQAQPRDLDASEIEVRLGATWIDKAYIQQFMYETFNTPYYNRGRINVNYSQFSAEWNITGKNAVNFADTTVTMTYGTSRANAYKILEGHAEPPGCPYLRHQAGPGRHGEAGPQLQGDDPGPAEAAGHQGRLPGLDMEGPHPKADPGAAVQRAFQLHPPA